MYLWMQALHVIGIILWMGGLFHLARHLGDHAELEDAAVREAFTDYESSTYYIGVLPGFILSLGTGLYMLFISKGGAGHYLNPDGTWGGTFHLKLLLIVILIGIDQTVHYKMRQLHRGEDTGRSFFMAAHGIVALSFIVIVVIVQTQILA
jgi:uncharacterized membrane protein